MDDVPKARYAEGLWVITVYYNPCKYKTRRANFDLFAESLKRAGIPLLTVECAFGDEPFELPDSCHPIRLRSASLLWQKERLLNLAASWLPASAQSVAWVDCDVIFLNERWATKTVELLKEHAVVQLFEKCVRLEQGNLMIEAADIVTSFAAVTGKDRSVLNTQRYDAHGHTGYAWAMRREIFDAVGLYEAAVSGSADHFMAHASYGHVGFCVENALKQDSTQIDHFRRWGSAFYELVQGKLAVVPGAIVHLWHGSLAKRDYFNRMWKITDSGFNPNTDLMIEPGKPIEWAPRVRHEKPKLVAYFDEYFKSRQEDGDTVSSNKQKNRRIA